VAPYFCFFLAMMGLAGFRFKATLLIIGEHTAWKEKVNHFHFFRQLCSFCALQAR
jgi:hypothetical protein